LPQAYPFGAHWLLVGVRIAASVIVCQQDHGGRCEVTTSSANFYVGGPYVQGVVQPPCPGGYTRSQDCYSDRGCWCEMNE